jgi:iron complex outermembrane receptor protein
MIRAFTSNGGPIHQERHKITGYTWPDCPHSIYRSRPDAACIAETTIITYIKPGMKLLFIISLIIYLLTGTGTVEAQQTVREASFEIQIRNTNTQEAIDQVLFRYGARQGVTGTDGRISISYHAETRLELSHVSYGSYILRDEELRKALEDGFYLWSERTTVLQPLTVISVRPGDQSRTTLVTGTSDRLTHDAGSFLQGLAAFSGVRKSGGYGYDPVLRGFKYNQLNVVIDGHMSASAACPNRMDPPTSQVAMNMVERVEIMKGPYALRFGNSFGGTINFISAEPEFRSAPTPYGRFSGSSELNNAIYRSEAVLGLRGKVADVALFGSWSRGDSYTDGRGIRLPSGFERGSFGLRSTIDITQTQRLQASLQRNLASDTEFASLPMDLISDKTLIGNLSWRYRPRHIIRLQEVNSSAWFSYVDHYMSNELRILNPRTTNAETAAETLNLGARSEALIAQTSAGKTYLGIDYHLEQAVGVRTREMLMGPMAGRIITDNAWQKSRIETAGVFGEWQRMSGANRFVVSGRLNMNYAESLDPDAGFLSVSDQTRVVQMNPSVSAGLIHSWNLKSAKSSARMTGQAGETNRRNVHLRRHAELNSGEKSLETGVWLGRSVRSAGITERYINLFPVGLDPYEMLGNPALKPEVNHQLDVITTWNSSRFRAEINLFQSLITDYISSQVDNELQPRIATSPGVRRYLNLDRAWIAGAEISVSQVLGRLMSHAGQLAWTYGQNLSTNEALPEIAPLDIRYTISATLWGGRMSPELSVRHVLAQNRVSESFGEQASRAFTRLDASAHWRGRSSDAPRLGWTEQLHIIAGVRNVFNTAYYEHLNRNIPGTGNPIFEPGRNIYITVGYAF